MDEFQNNILGSHHSAVLHLRDHLPETGFIRAVATAQREPLGYTIIRALRRGGELSGPTILKSSKVLPCLRASKRRCRMVKELQTRKYFVASTDLQETHMGIMLIIDELGKGLEHAAWHQESDDLYLLQQLAELPADDQSPKVFVLGLLHQSFTEYSQKLTEDSTQRMERKFKDGLRIFHLHPPTIICCI